MSKEKRYLQWGYDSFKDTKTGEISDNHIHILNKQAERIAELEEQLKNAIVPKFKIGQELYLIDDYYSIIPFEIDKILITENGVEIKSVEWSEWFEEDECFITREEAQAKLEELKGE